MPAFIDLTGKRFTRLVVIEIAGKRKHGAIRWLCKCDCGSEVIVDGNNLRRSISKSCGCLRSELTKLRNRNNCGKNSVMWNGGRRRTSGGYIAIYCPDHPRHSGSYVNEHVLVMESKLGRFLHSGENVHHLNGIRDDNRPENLELWTINQPKGQRVEDKVKHAEEILALYKHNQMPPGCRGVFAWLAA
jgi:hypothetical protein